MPSVDRRAMSDTALRASSEAASTSRRREDGGWAMSASVNNSHSGRGVVPRAAAAPWAMAQGLPAHPGGRGWPATTRRASLALGAASARARAWSAVPSVLLSSTSTTSAGPG